MFGSIIIAIVLASSALAEDGEIEIPNNKSVCIDDMVQWCNSMQYSQGVGMAILSVTFEDPSGFYRVLCYSDSDGTNCTRNSNPWFGCSPEHTFSYKGQPVTSASTDVDDDICKTADKALNELFVQNLGYNSTSLQEEVQKGMRTFLDQMEAMQAQIEEIQKRLLNFPFFDQDFFPKFGNGFPFNQNNPTPMTPDDSSSSSSSSSSSKSATDQWNEVEKE